MEDNNTKRMKIIATILHVIAVITRVCIYIGAVCLLLGAIAIPSVFKNIKLEKNLVEYKGSTKKDSFKLYREDDKLIAYYGDKEHNLDKELSNTELEAVDGLFNLVTDTTKGTIIAYLEIVTLLGFAALVIFAEGIRRIERVLKNIKERDKVFELENAEYFKKAAILFGALYIVTLVMSIFVSKTFKLGVSTSFNMVGISEILILFFAHYIFLYGNKLEEAKSEAPIKKTSTRKPRTTKKKKEEE